MHRSFHFLLRTASAVGVHAETARRAAVSPRVRAAGVLRWGVVALALFATCSLGTPARAAGDGDSLEYRIKTAYLYNFTKFVDWPDAAFANATTPFTIGVLAADAADATAQAAMELLDGKASGPRTIEVRFFAHAGPELADCHLVFITRAAREELARARAEIGSRPVLIVGESDGFAQRGGTINLAVTGDTVRCEINLRQAERTGLKLSGRLASVARLVREEANP